MNTLMPLLDRKLRRASGGGCKHASPTIGHVAPTQTGSIADLYQSQRHTDAPRIVDLVAPFLAAI